MLFFNVLPSDDSSVFSKTRTIYNIRFPLNLGGETIELPQDVVLNFCGGFISNGDLVGNNTLAKFTKNCIQNNVNFSGTWNIPYISSDILTSPNDANSLKILCNLLSEDSYNVLHIQPGSYIFNPLQNADKLILLKSNTKLIVDGDIAITPNGYTNYSIVRAENSQNIEILGKGSIVGDADDHDYTTIPSTHEWGMCVNVAGCENVYIHDITLKDATGDGIDISESSLNEPKQIMVCRCRITHCGRQGISVTAGEQVKISNCFIDDIYRTAPMAAVDLEANSGHRVVGVDVEDLLISRCKGLMAIHSDFVSLKNIKSLNCNSLFYFEDAKFIDVFNVYSSSNVSSSDFIRATNDCENIVFSKVNTINNEETFVINLNYIQTDYLCNFGLASIVGQPKESSTKYSSGKFLQYNGIDWVNFDGTST